MSRAIAWDTPKAHFRMTYSENQEVPPTTHYSPNLISSGGAVVQLLVQTLGSPWNTTVHVAGGTSAARHGCALSTRSPVHFKQLTFQYISLASGRGMKCSLCKICCWVTRLLAHLPLCDCFAVSCLTSLLLFDFHFRTGILH